MFRLSKTTDYGIVLMAQLASHADGFSPGKAAASKEIRPAEVPTPLNARELAQSSDLPLPMVSKILKALAREGLLLSQRGSKGGYSLARAPEDLPVAEMVRVLEGPVALTDCAIGPSLCEHETMCAVREPWQKISRVVERALENVTLADLVQGHAGASSIASPTLQIQRAPEESADTTIERTAKAGREVDALAKGRTSH
jgi:Rrf2 family protein